MNPQRNYNLNPKKTEMMGSKPASTPMEKDVKFQDTSTGIDKSKHQQFAGKLINLPQTGPNIRFLASRIRLIMNVPTEEQM